MTALAARQEPLRLIDDIPDEERKTTETAATPDEEHRARIHAALLEVQESWATHDDGRTVDQIVRDMRRGRQFDIR